jgi:biopolymer transport protein ExbD
MTVGRLERKRARIEMIPLIDVTFLLLSFFIYVSLFMIVQRGVPLQLPKASTSSPERSEVIEVSVDGSGRLFVDGAETSMEDLPGVLREKAATLGLEKVSLRGDRWATYDRIMQVLDGIRRAGIGKVSLETRGEEG